MKIRGITEVIMLAKILYAACTVSETLELQYQLFYT